MSFWRKLFSKKEKEQAPEEQLDPVTESEQAPQPPSPLMELQAMARGEGDVDETRAIDLFERLIAQNKMLAALEAARNILARHTGLPLLGLRLAERLSARGEDDGAWNALVSFRQSMDAPLGAWLLAGEIAERRGEKEQALTLYERILARNLDYPRARERAERLRGEQGPRQDMAGATLATDGALARGRYRIEKELGRGGAGTVFAAQDLALGRRVALKVYHRRGPMDAQRLGIEARTPASFEHPGVVRIFDIDYELGAIAMEWVPGGAIRRELSAERVSMERAQKWIHSAAEALSFVHAGAVAHRDVKPSNLLVRPDDQVVLTDFGIAMPVGERPAGHGGEGTLRYAPAEQRAGRVAAPSADIYALGVTIEEILEPLKDVPSAWKEAAVACRKEDPEARASLVDVAKVFAA